MSRFTPDFFDTVYHETPPWDVGAAQPALESLFDEHPPAGPVLDLGCGSGDLAIALAQRGVDAVGIDIVHAPIHQAREKARALPAEVARRLDFHVGDATRPSLLGRRFGAVVDSGFFHLFDQEQRDRLAMEVAATLAPGGRYYLLEFAVEFPIPNTPLQVTEDELRARFTAANGWRILALRPARFESRIAPVAAVAACIQRLGSAGDAEDVIITRAGLTDEASRSLIAELNAELSGMYPEAGANHFGLVPEEVAEGRGAFLVVHRAGEPVGCGAVRMIDAETGELKRMYVAPAARGTGLGRRLVDALQAEARALGARRLVLETGTRQHAAIALYQAAGFRRIPLYGEYLSSPGTSICMGKDLAAAD